MTRNGKIARLPRHIRQELNCLLREGVQAKALVEMLNEKSEVKRMLGDYFGGVPISAQNLSEWRQGGYLEWLRNEEACEMVDRMREESADLEAIADEIDISQWVGTKMAVELARVAEALMEEAGSAKERWERMREMLPHLAQLRRADQRAHALALKRQEWAWNYGMGDWKEARREVFHRHSRQRYPKTRPIKPNQTQSNQNLQEKCGRRNEGEVGKETGEDKEYLGSAGASPYREEHEADKGGGDGLVAESIGEAPIGATGAVALPGDRNSAIAPTCTFPHISAPMAAGRRQYPFDLIEPKWQSFWDARQTFRAFNPGDTVPPEHPFAKRHKLEGMKPTAAELPPKHYILDMFPYPSGAGLHVGHPEGYTATDILSRYRRARGFNVLHPMGWDAFGLPAEQYAIKTGQHPRKTTEENIATFKRQIKSLGFSYDWTREVDTTDPEYFRWTQWIFLKLYNSWFNPETNKAEPIETLNVPEELISRRSTLEKARGFTESHPPKGLSPEELGRIESSMEMHAHYDVRAFHDERRLAYVSEQPVWWCEALGTVLANEEVVDGKSEVGGHPVVRKPMRQWVLRITAFAERLLNDLEGIDWTHSLKEMQRNWIGRSEGAEVDFQIVGHDEKIPVFTTRPDTLFGATYMVLAPEHRLVEKIATSDNVFAYRNEVSKKSDLERTELSKEKTGVFIGAYAINPVNQEKIPIWIADYVLASYGTGAIMAVPAHDERDFEFATKFQLPIPQVVLPPSHDFDKAKAFLFDINQFKPGLIITGWTFGEGSAIKGASAESNPFTSEGVAINSANSEVSLNGLSTADAKEKITTWLEEKGLGKKTINYKLRDWLFSRQRYWGEPFPIVWKKDASGNLYHEALPESALPVLPPKLDDYKPTPDGQPPLARAQDWVNLPDGSVRETNTMPQWAGSCWYYLRYLDAGNDGAFVSKETERYWMGADSVAAVYDRRNSDGADTAPLQKPGVDLYVGGTEHAVLHLLYARFWHKVLFDLGYVSTAEPFFKLVNQGIILGEDGQKMSKARGNVVNPDELVRDFGADSLRLYEMFMGPLEMVKPWSTKNVEGVYRFLGRVWRLFVDEQSEADFEQELTTTKEPRNKELLDILKLNPAIQDVAVSPAQLKTLHATIKKVTEDLDGMRFNTAISALMMFVNEAMTWEVKPRAVLRDFLILLQPFAPHIAEELWSRLTASKAEALDLAYQPWPVFDAALLVEDTLEIPVQVNGKLRDKLLISANATEEEIKALALASEKVKPYLEGKTVKKVIVVPKRLVNIAVA